MNKGQKIILLIIAISPVVFLFLVFLPRTIGLKSAAKNVILQETKEASTLRAVSFVSPHHLVAEKLIDDIFQKVADANKRSGIKRIILLSPNHENIGHGRGILADKNWNTKNGLLQVDQAALKIILEKKELFSLDNKAFEAEHGILNLLPFVKKYFPEASVVPIMIRDGLSEVRAMEMAELFANNFGSETMVVLSADFSHYVGKVASQMHDQESIEVMKNFDYAKMQNLDVDCRGGLMILEKFSAKLGFGKFNLVDNSNSSRIYGQDFGEKNTSYVTGYFSKGEKEKEEKSVNMLFLGDLMLDRDMRTLIARKGVAWPTEKIQRLFWSQDLNVANLEGPITANASISLGSLEEEKRHLMFTFDSEVAGAFLEKNNINAVDIGNNHVLNFKTAGLEETEKALLTDKVEYFGSPMDKNNYFLKNVQGQKIAMVSYNQFSGISAEAVAELVRELKPKSDRVIVFAHWGKEYQLTQDYSQQEKAHLFVDAGADLVVGSHPHVVQPMEIYKNKAIFYSLGNFVFDQYFSEEVKTRLALGVVWKKERIDFYLIPLYLEKNGQLSILEGEKKKVLLDRLAQTSTVSESIRAEIMAGVVNLAQL